MKGCRPLTLEEVRDVSLSFGGAFAKRDKALFVLGVTTGFRISELLSLKVGDVWQHGQIVDRVTVRRRNVKRKSEGRTVPVHPAARQALSGWIGDLEKRRTALDPNTPLFPSRKGDKAITRVQAYQILREAFEANALTGTLGTHTMRKTYAAQMWESLDRNLVAMQKALGHKSVSSTVSYLSFDQEKIDDAVLSIQI